MLTDSSLLEGLEVETSVPRLLWCFEAFGKYQFSKTFKTVVEARRIDVDEVHGATWIHGMKLAHSRPHVDGKGTEGVTSVNIIISICPFVRPSLCPSIRSPCLWGCGLSGDPVNHGSRIHWQEEHLVWLGHKEAEFLKVSDDCQGRIFRHVCCGFGPLGSGLHSLPCATTNPEIASGPSQPLQSKAPKGFAARCVVLIIMVTGFSEFMNLAISEASRASNSVAHLSLPSLPLCWTFNSLRPEHHTARFS